MYNTFERFTGIAQVWLFFRAAQTSGVVHLDHEYLKGRKDDAELMKRWSTSPANADPRFEVTLLETSKIGCFRRGERLQFIVVVVIRAPIVRAKH